MLTIIVCSFPVLMIMIRGKLKSQQRNKRAEKLHKHAHTAILPTDTFKLQISAQKRRLALCAGKHSSTSSKKYVLKAFFDITFYNCKDACKLPK